jgi:hypothetical protein
MTGEYACPTGADDSRVDQTVLSMAELEMVGGGADPNYHQCLNGTEAVGGPSLYPVYVACKA